MPMPVHGIISRFDEHGWMLVLNVTLSACDILTASFMVSSSPRTRSSTIVVINVANSIDGSDGSVVGVSVTVPTVHISSGAR